MIFTLLELSINLIEALLDSVLLINRLNLKKFKFSTIIFPILIFLTITFCNTFVPSVTASLLIILLSEIGLALLLTTNSIRSRIFWGCIPSVLSLVAESIVLFLSNFIIGSQMNLIKDTSPVRYGLVITYLLMLAAFVFVIIHIGKNKLFFPHYILISFFVLIIIGITATQQLIYIISSIENISFRGSDKIISHLYSTGIAFIILLVCLFFLIFIIGKVNKKIFTLQEIKAQHKLEEAEYEAIISNNKILRTWKHEYINHLQTLFYMINTNKNDKAQEYIQQLTDEMHNSTQAINSGNFAVDAILSMKQQEMQNNNIQFNSTIYLPEPQTIPLNDAQISALLGNLLNNAIEAAKETKVPTINLSIKPVIDNLVIEMTNSSVGNYKYNSSNELISSKGKNRGIGLKRITDIVQRVDGFVEFKPEPNLFTTKIIVPLLDNAI